MGKLNRKNRMFSKVKSSWKVISNKILEYNISLIYNLIKESLDFDTRKKNEKIYNMMISQMNNVKSKHHNKSLN
jgi:hypothetical protein